MHYYKLMLSTVLITITSSHPIQAAADDILHFKTTEWPIDETLTVDPNLTVAHSIVLTEKEPNTKETFQKLWKHAKHKNVPWVLLCQRIILSDNSSFIQYSDPVEVIKTSGIPYDKQSFASAESAGKTMYEASKALLMKLHPGFTCQVIEAYIWSPDFIDPYNGFYITKSKQGSKKLSDLSCTLAIRLCHDYSQLLPIISVLKTFLKKHANKKEKALFKKKFWLDTLHKLPQKTQDRLVKEADVFTDN